MPGALAIIVALLLFPVVAVMGSTLIAAGLGWALNRDAADRAEGSELLDHNY